MSGRSVPRALPRYRRALPYGWVLGAFPVLALLRHAPDRAREVRYHAELAPERCAAIGAACAEAGVPMRRDDATVREKRSKGTARVLAVFDKHVAHLDPARRHVLLHAPRDPGNLGTALRTALALGVEDVAVTAGSDPWSPHVMRASQGASFALRLATPRSLAAYRATVPARSLLMLDGAAGADLADLPPADGPRTVAVGPEWPGFTAAELEAGTPVRIGLDPRVESLNVAVALGVALHATRPRRPTGATPRT